MPSVAAAAQAMLEPGQRLVSPDGGLWRWDGFVRAPGSEDGAAARVRHHLRLHVARDELAALAASLRRAGGRRHRSARWRCRRRAPGPGRGRGTVAGGRYRPAARAAAAGRSGSPGRTAGGRGVAAGAGGRGAGARGDRAGRSRRPRSSVQPGRSPTSAALARPDRRRTCCADAGWRPSSPRAAAEKSRLEAAHAAATTAAAHIAGSARADAGRTGAGARDGDPGGTPYR